MKDIIILGGPNGAGKTTAAKDFLPGDIQIAEFVNADEIARGLSPLNPENAPISAGKAMLGRIKDLVKREQSFAFETTCAGHNYINLMRKCVADGWRVTLFFLWLPTPADAVERVRRRVASGGHNIPEQVIIRRYWSGLQNMRELYLPLADIAAIYDNSDEARILIAKKAADTGFEVCDDRRWSEVTKERR